MGVFANIQRVLDEKIKTAPSNTYISWPNTNVKPGNAQLTQYIRPTMLLAATDVYTLNDYERIPGIYQIDVFGQTNRGVGQVYNIADEIKTHFESSRTLIQDGTVVLIKGISMRQAEREDAWFKVIVEVNFICYNN